MAGSVGGAIRCPHAVPPPRDRAPGPRGPGRRRWACRPTLRNREPGFRLCFARLVTRYWGNAGFLEDGLLVREAHRPAGIPTFLAHGRRDISAPADVPVALARQIPGAELSALR